jgi:hypothetical protein
VTLVIERDVLEIRKVRQRQVLPQVLRRLADQTGQSATSLRHSLYQERDVAATGLGEGFLSPGG